MATSPTIVGDHICNHPSSDITIGPFVRHTHGGPGFPCFTRQLQAGFIAHLKWPHRHANGLAHIVNFHRVHALSEQLQALIKVGAEGSRGEESEGIINHNGGFTDLLGEIESLGQGFITGFVTDDNFHQRHLIHWRKKVDADEVFRLIRRFCQLSYWQCRRIRAPEAIVR